TYDPANGCSSIRSWYHILARGAVRDVKRRRSAGTVGRAELAEPKHARTEPTESQPEAAAVANKILTARSEAYVLRWCKRPDVDAIDRDIVCHHLLQPGFLSLGDIAGKYGVTRQAVAKRRKRIVADLTERGSRRGSDAQTPKRRSGSWLSHFQSVP